MDKLTTSVLHRLATLEAVVLGRAAEQPADPTSDRRLTKREVALRRGKSMRGVERDVKRGLLPPPDIENGRWYWWLSVLQRHERAAAPQPRRPRPGTRATAAEE
jgi:hypothetical protein